MVGFVVRWSVGFLVWVQKCTVSFLQKNVVNRCFFGWFEVRQKETKRSEKHPLVWFDLFDFVCFDVYISLN